MTIKQMQYYLSLCRTQNMTRSAKALYVSQPTLSVAMKELEAEVGFPLFNKAGARLALTEAGARLSGEIAGIMDKYNQMESMIRAGGFQQNMVRLGFSSVAGNSIAPLICRQFISDHPDMSIRIVEDIGRFLLAMLENEQLDAVLTGRGYNTDGPFAGRFNTLDLSLEPMVYCVSADSPLARLERISPEEIAREPVIMLKENIPAATMIENWFADRGCPLNIAFRTGRLFTVERFVACGVAGGFLPELCCRDNISIVPVYCPELEETNQSTVSLYWKKQDGAVADLIRSARKAAKLM